MSKYDAAIGTLEMERTRILRELSDVDSALAIMRKLRIRDAAATPGAWTTAQGIDWEARETPYDPLMRPDKVAGVASGDDKLARTIDASNAIPAVIPKEPTEEML